MEKCSVSEFICTSVIQKVWEVRNVNKVVIKMEIEQNIYITMQTCDVILLILFNSLSSFKYFYLDGKYSQQLGVQLDDLESCSCLEELINTITNVIINAAVVSLQSTLDSAIIRFVNQANTQFC